MIPLSPSVVLLVAIALVLVLAYLIASMLYVRPKGVLVRIGPGGYSVVRGGGFVLPYYHTVIVVPSTPVPLVIDREVVFADRSRRHIQAMFEVRAMPDDESLINITRLLGEFKDYQEAVRQVMHERVGHIVMRVASTTTPEQTLADSYMFLWAAVLTATHEIAPLGFEIRPEALILHPTDPYRGADWRPIYE